MKQSLRKLTETEMAAAWRRRDAGYDGLFVFGVRTTGIFCRPSCPSSPKREHLDFFATNEAALQAGYRPCRRCHPEQADGTAPNWVTELMRSVEKSPEQRLSARELRARGLAPEKVRRWFQKHLGQTFAAWSRARRLSGALAELRGGRGLDDVALGHGYESHSGFRAAFRQSFGRSPGRARAQDCLHVELLATPLGPLLAAATSEALVQLEFADRQELVAARETLRRRFDLPLVPGSNPVLMQLKEELPRYFAGKLREFRVPISLAGTPWQERVWTELRLIPFGQTRSYADIARRLGRPTAVRAVARANALNRLYLLVPCHRVIAQDGSLSGYGGGVWRKRRLLELEQAPDRLKVSGRPAR